MKKYKFRWAEQRICEGIVEAKTQEEAEEIFNASKPDDAEDVDLLDYDGGLSCNLLSVDEISSKREIQHEKAGEERQ